MSLYQLHRCVYDFIRAGSVASDGGDVFDSDRYDLSEEERRAFDTRDVGALYGLGLHSVLLNAFCRAVGYSRDDYRKLLQPFSQPEQRRGRWAASS